MVVGMRVPAGAGRLLMVLALLLHPDEQAPDLPVGGGKPRRLVEVCQRCGKLPGDGDEKSTTGFSYDLVMPLKTLKDY